MITRIIKLQEKDGYLYKLANDSYDSIYNNIMSKGDIKLNSSFLGNSPATLSFHDFPKLVNTEYHVSTKVDGLRYLLMIGNKTDLSDRNVFLVDKNKDFWIISTDKKILPAISNIPNCLLDGELYIDGEYSQTNTIIETDSYVYYSAFDILYGPTKPELEDESVRRRLVLGSSGAFMGPKGGPRWPFLARYSVLGAMVLNILSPLHRWNTNENFKIILSPFLRFSEVANTDKNIYKYMVKLYNQEIQKQTGKKLKVNTDGLIFTPSNAEYSGKCIKIYKWKESKDLTIDVRVGEPVESRFKNAKAYSIYAKNDSKIGVLLSTQELRDDSIVECRWLEEIYFEYVRTRKDKKQPNAKLTVLGVIRAIKNPFPLDKLVDVYTKGLKSAKQVLNSDHQYKIRCAIKNNPGVLFGEEFKEKFINLVENFKLSWPQDPVELETRIRVPNPECLLEKLPQMKDPHPTIKLGGGQGMRESRVVLGNSSILEDNIQKVFLAKVEYIPNDIVGAAGYRLNSMDTYLSEEKPLKKKFKINRYRYQKRYELNPLPFSNFSPSLLWRLDITKYGDSTKSALDAEKNFNLKPQVSIEIEYAPGDQETNMWKYWESTGNKTVLEDIVRMYRLPVKESVEKSLQDRISKINSLSSEFIYKDWCNMVVFLFGLLN